MTAKNISITILLAFGLTRLLPLQGKQAARYYYYYFQSVSREGKKGFLTRRRLLQQIISLPFFAISPKSYLIVGAFL